MKKITFILLALLTGTAFGQTPVSSTAEIIEAVTFSEVTGLDFGRLDNNAGTFSIDAAGTAGGTKSQAPGGTASPAELTVSGAPDEAYVIQVSSSTKLTGVGADMYVDFIGHNATQTLDSNGDETVNIGGTLTVNAGQLAGTYTGEIIVTVSYN